MWGRGSEVVGAAGEVGEREERAATWHSVPYFQSTFMKSEMEAA